MNTRRKLLAARTLSLLALATALAFPWLGWRALAATAVLLLLVVLVTPRRTGHAHKPRMRSALDALRRRLARHPWRPTGF